MLNLLQGEFAPAIQVATFLRPLRLAAVVLAIAVIGGLTVDLWEWWWLHRAHVSSRQEMTRLFLESFPDQKVVVDPALQMQRQIEALQTRQGVPGARDFLPLLRRITPVLGANAGSGVRALTYADRELTVTVVVPDRPALDRLAADLGRVGLNTEILAANSRAEGLQGQLRIRAPAAVDAARTRP
jgi:general secretion pathway protein L